MSKPDIFPYRVEQQPDGRWAVVLPILGVIPEYMFATEDEAYGAAFDCKREDNES